MHQLLQVVYYCYQVSSERLKQTVHEPARRDHSWETSIELHGLNEQRTLPKLLFALVARKCLRTFAFRPSLTAPQLSFLGQQ